MTDNKTIEISPDQVKVSESLISKSDDIAGENFENKTDIFAESVISMEEALVESSNKEEFTESKMNTNTFPEVSSPDKIKIIETENSIDENEICSNSSCKITITEYEEPVKEETFKASIFCSIEIIEYESTSKENADLIPDDSSYKIEITEYENLISNNDAETLNSSFTEGDENRSKEKISKIWDKNSWTESLNRQSTEVNDESNTDVCFETNENKILSQEPSRASNLECEKNAFENSDFSEAVKANTSPIKTSAKKEIAERDTSLIQESCHSKEHITFSEISENFSHERGDLLQETFQISNKECEKTAYEENNISQVNKTQDHFEGSDSSKKEIKFSEEISERVLHEKTEISASELAKNNVDISETIPKLTRSKENNSEQSLSSENIETFLKANVSAPCETLIKKIDDTQQAPIKIIIEDFEEKISKSENSVQTSCVISEKISDFESLESDVIDKVGETEEVKDVRIIKTDENSTASILDENVCESASQVSSVSVFVADTKNINECGSKHSSNEEKVVHVAEGELENVAKSSTENVVTTMEINNVALMENNVYDNVDYPVNSSEAENKSDYAFESSKTTSKQEIESAFQEAAVSVNMTTENSQSFLLTSPKSTSDTTKNTNVSESIFVKSVCVALPTENKEIESNIEKGTLDETCPEKQETEILEKMQSEVQFATEVTHLQDTGLTSTKSYSKYPYKLSDAIANLEKCLLDGHQIKHISIPAPDFNYTVSHAYPEDFENAEFYECSVEVSRYDWSNIYLRVDENKLDIVGRQEQQNEFGYGFNEMHYTFPIPSGVDKDHITANISPDYRLRVRMPFKDVECENESK